jgi:translocation and assembly module TamA
LGAGIRYYTPIGPVRFDFAVPLKHYIRNGDPFEIYVGLGQAF